MEHINSYVVQICICAVAVSVAEGLLPAGHVKKSVCFLLGLVVLLCFVSPLRSIGSEDFTFSIDEIDTDNTDWFSRMTVETFTENVTALIERCMEETGVQAKDIEIYTNEEDGEVTVAGAKITIDEGDRELIGDITDNIYDTLGIDADVTVR